MHRIRYVFAALAFTVAMSSGALAEAPPSCSGGSTPICQKESCSGIPRPTCTCTQWACAVTGGGGKAAVRWSTPAGRGWTLSQ